jgi:hypothetical protein
MYDDEDYLVVQGLRDHRSRLERMPEWLQILVCLLGIALMFVVTIGAFLFLVQHG